MQILMALPYFLMKTFTLIKAVFFALDYGIIVQLEINIIRGNHDKIKRRYSQYRHYRSR